MYPTRSQIISAPLIRLPESFPLFTYFPFQAFNKYLGKIWHYNWTSPNTKLVAKADPQELQSRDNAKFEFLAPGIPSNSPDNFPKSQMAGTT